MTTEFSGKLVMLGSRTGLPRLQYDSRRFWCRSGWPLIGLVRCVSAERLMKWVKDVAAMKFSVGWWASRRRPSLVGGVPPQPRTRAKPSSSHSCQRKKNRVPQRGNAVGVWSAQRDGFRVWTMSTLWVSVPAPVCIPASGPPGMAFPRAVRIEWGRRIAVVSRSSSTCDHGTSPFADGSVLRFLAPSRLML